MRQVPHGRTRLVIAGTYSLVLLGWILLVTDPTQQDFASLYATAYTFRTGEAMASLRVNLNPPTLDLLLLPFTWFSVQVAYWLWTAFCLIALVATMRRIGQSLGWSGWQVAEASAIALAVSVTWFQEATTILPLAYLVTRAFLSRTQTWQAGAWLALAILLKPPLVFLGIVLGWPMLMGTAVAGVSFSAGLVLLTGWPAWARWIDRCQDVPWIGWPANASLWGVASRLTSGEVWGFGMSDLGLVALLAVLAILGVLLWLVLRSSGATRWALATCWTVLASPIGWTFYVCVSVAAFVSAWPSEPIRRRVATGLVVASGVPMLVWSLGEQAFPSTGLFWQSHGTLIVLAAMWAWRK